MRKSNFVKSIVLIVLICVTLCFITACSESAEKKDPQIYAVYKAYADYAQNNNETPLSYEEWLKSIRGERGITPEFRIDYVTGVWEVSYDNGDTWNSLYQKACGKDGVDGKDGKDGINGIDGKDGVNGKDGISPKLRINAETGMWEVSYDDEKTWVSLNVKAAGIDGRDGLSAYEQYVKNNPSYKKTEEEWLADLASGALHVINITLDGNGGEVSENSIVTKAFSYVNVDKPARNGYDFVELWKIH